MKRLIAALGFVGLLSVGTVHAEEAVGHTFDSGRDGPILRVSDLPTSVCVNNDFCLDMQPGEVVLDRHGDYFIVAATAPEAQCDAWHVSTVPMASSGAHLEQCVTTMLQGVH